MYWDVSTVTEPIAKKDYHCQASDWIDNYGYKDEFSKDDLDLWEKALSEKCRIKKGTKYVKVVGKFDGDWVTFRARKDLDGLCHKHKIYDCY